MNNKNGFTLIELLAVIIILGILMIIAIPSVTKYISDSRKNAYVDTAKELIGSARNIVNSGQLEMYDTNTTYYIDVACIKSENATKSPYGDFVQGGAYVVVTYDGKGYTYYWTSVDDAGQGIKDIVRFDKLDPDKIDSDLSPSDITTTRGIDGRESTVVIRMNSTTGSCTKDGSNPATINISGETGEIAKIIDYPENKDRDTLALGDMVKIKGEEFYVIKIDRQNDKITLFARYNLKVGKIYSSSDIAEYLGEIDSNDPDYGRQNSQMRGGIPGEMRYGTVAFSNTRFWSGTYISTYKNIYDDNVIPKQYIDNYANYLGDVVKESRLLTRSEANTIIDNNLNVEINNTTFWLGTVDEYYAYGVQNGNIQNFNYDIPTWYGVRPVIVI